MKADRIGDEIFVAMSPDEAIEIRDSHDDKKAGKLLREALEQCDELEEEDEFEDDEEDDDDFAGGIEEEIEGLDESDPKEEIEGLG